MSERVPDPEKLDWITRCPRCGRLPRSTLMGRTICDACGGLDVPQPLDPGAPKGIFDGKCNRTACPTYGARWYSPVEHAHYCEKCAKEINIWSARAGVATMYPVTSTAQREAK